MLLSCSADSRKYEGPCNKSPTQRSYSWQSCISVSILAGHDQGTMEPSVFTETKIHNILDTGSALRNLTLLIPISFETLQIIPPIQLPSFCFASNYSIANQRTRLI